MARVARTLRHTCKPTHTASVLNNRTLSMANCYFAKPQGMQHCYIPFFMLLISNALLVLARHRCGECSHFRDLSGYDCPLGGTGLESCHAADCPNWDSNSSELCRRPQWSRREQPIHGFQAASAGSGHCFGFHSIQSPFCTSPCLRHNQSGSWFMVDRHVAPCVFLLCVTGRCSARGRSEGASSDSSVFFACRINGVHDRIRIRAVCYGDCDWSQHYRPPASAHRIHVDRAQRRNVCINLDHDGHLWLHFSRDIEPSATCIFPCIPWRFSTIPRKATPAF